MGTLKNLTPHHPVTINAEMSRTAQDQRGGHSKLIGEHQGGGELAVPTEDIMERNSGHAMPRQPQRYCLGPKENIAVVVKESCERG